MVYFALLFGLYAKAQPLNIGFSLSLEAETALRQNFDLVCPQGQCFGLTNLHNKTLAVEVLCGRVCINLAHI